MPRLDGPVSPHVSQGMSAFEHGRGPSHRVRAASEWRPLLVTSWHISDGGGEGAGGVDVASGRSECGELEPEVAAELAAVRPGCQLERREEGRAGRTALADDGHRR